MTNSSAVLEVKELSKVYHSKATFFSKPQQVVALNRISLAVNRGEVFGLVGESGSGKTTCGRLIVGLEQPTRGEITLEGRQISGLSASRFKPFRRKLQMVFQDPYQSLNPQLTIYDSVAEPLITNKVGSRDNRYQMVVEVLGEVGLTPPEDFLSRFPHQLSGGQRQRVAIARAMVLDPSLVVTDEPTSMLDASYSAQIFDLLLAMRVKHQTTIVFITHALAAARYLCDRIAVIYRGNLMETGPAQEVISNPKHPYTQALIDATPKFGQRGGLPHYGSLLEVERIKASKLVGCVFFSRCNCAQRVKCARQRPELRPMADGHLAACHYATPGPPAPVGACAPGE